MRIGQHRVCSPRWIIELRDCLEEVLSGGNSVRVCLGEAEFGKYLGAIITLGWLCEGTTEIGGCRLRRALCEGALGCAPERRNDETIARRHCSDEVGRGLLRYGTTIKQQHCGLAGGRAYARLRFMCSKTELRTTGCVNSSGFSMTQ